GAVRAAVAAEVGDGQEHLGREGDRSPPPPVAQGAGGGEQLGGQLRRGEERERLVARQLLARERLRERLAERVTRGHGAAGGELGHGEVPSGRYRTGPDVSSRRGLRAAAAFGGREVGDDEVARGAVGTRRHGERRPEDADQAPGQAKPEAEETRGTRPGAAGD